MWFQFPQLKMEVTFWSSNLCIKTSKTLFFNFEIVKCDSFFFFGFSLLPSLKALPMIYFNFLLTKNRLFYTSLVFLSHQQETKIQQKFSDLKIDTSIPMALKILTLKRIVWPTI